MWRSEVGGRETAIWIKYSVWLGSSTVLSKEIRDIFTSVLSMNLIVSWSPLALLQDFVSGWCHDCVRLQNGSLGFCLPWCCPELWEPQAENEWTLNLSVVPPKVFSTLSDWPDITLICYVIWLCVENHWSHIYHYQCQQLAFLESLLYSRHCARR